MKVCIDGLSLSHLSGTGCYTYLYGLSSCLFQIFPQPDYYMLLSHEFIIPEWEKYKNIKYLDIEVNRRNNDYTALEQEMKKEHINLYISPNNGFSLPVKKVGKYVMIVHDVAPMSIENLVDDKYSEKFRKTFPKALENADAVIADSEFIKGEIVRYYSVDAKKITVMYPCCLGIFHSLEPLVVNAVLNEKYNIYDKYVLCVGSIHPRKNLEVVIKSFQMLAKEYEDYKLVLVGDYGGKRQDYYYQLMELVRKLHLEEHVIFTGSVELTDMPYFYNGAACVVNISEYEGFPITGIEASSCGIPYICLNNSSFSEIEIPTGIYLEDKEATALKDTMIQVINQERKNKSIKPQYCWDREIKKMIRIIENLIYG